ncbi:hypothetical protein COO60DRAFT_1706535 [Scenedesmus sp. NREL 46B-D3]|nr:hypothetical protein COO60DRAFT_1706535 [Scenedesmus sp. NREL 46B-D3]
MNLQLQAQRGQYCSTSHTAAVGVLHPTHRRYQCMRSTNSSSLHLPASNSAVMGISIRKSRICVSTGSSRPLTSTQEDQQSATHGHVVHTDALIIGGGPAGLAAAMMLAKRGWRVTVAERQAEVSYADPDRSYVYAIDGRGRVFTDAFGLTGKLADAGVDTKAVEVNRVFPSGKVVSARQSIKDEARVVYWLPRMNFVSLLEHCVTEGDFAPYVTLATNTEATDIRRLPNSSSSSSGKAKQVQVTLRNSVTSETQRVVPKLLLGCDGMKSLVRHSLLEWAAEDDTMGASSAAAHGSSGSGSSSKFSMAEYPSLSTDLRFKVLQLLPNPAMKDGTVLRNPSFCLLAGRKSKSIGGPPLRLGLLPIKDESVGRTANLITLPDHPVWRVSDAATLYKVFEEAFPQADWRALVPEPVMAKFAASRGGQFPAPQHSRGLSLLVSTEAAPGAAAPDAAAIKGTGGAAAG